MIENIHDHEGKDRRGAGKVDYSFKVPKNIKQIGECTDLKKIYVEDYVFTYIKDLVGKEYMECRIAVLLGKYVKTQDERIIMINGAVEADLASYDTEDVFTNDVWADVYEYIRRYFSDVEVVGWFIGGPGFAMQNEDKLRKIHLDNFAGSDKALLKYDSIEAEEAFYIYENGSMHRMSGYYIYYDKNESMQNYIVDNKKERISGGEYKEKEKERKNEYKDEVKEEKIRENNRSVMHLLYAAGSLMVLIVLVVFATLLHSNNKIRSLESAVDELNAVIHASSNHVGVSEEDAADETMNVETISGKLSSVHNEDVVGDRADIKQTENDSKKEEGQDSEKKEEGKKEDGVTKKNETEEDAKKQEDPSQKDAEKTTDNKDGQQESAENKENGAKNNQAENAIITAADGTKYYVVQKGDTLASISYKLYQSKDYVSVIAELNKIENYDMIYYGLKLMVP